MIKLKDIYENLIQEGKQIGIIYHFTDMESLNGITSNYTSSDPELNASDDVDYDLSPSSTYLSFISTTRNYNFYVPGGTVRITLDGDKISQRYTVEPINFFAAAELHPNRRDAVNRKNMLQKFKTRGEHREDEERVWMTEVQTGLLLRKYCLEVAIRVTRDLTKSYLSKLIDMRDYFSRMGIPFLVTTKFKPYGRDKGIQLPESL